MKKSIITLFILPILLGGCSLNDKDINVFNNLDVTETSENILIEASASQIDAYLKAKIDFPLFIYQTGCGHCQLVSQYLDKYVKENKSTIYALNTFSDDYQSLKEIYPSIFYAGQITPTFYIFKDENHYSIDLSVMEEETLFFRTLDQYFTESNFNILTSNVNKLTTYLDDDNYFLLCFDNTDLDMLNLFKDSISMYAKMNKTLLYVPCNIISEEIEEQLNTIFNGDYNKKAIISISGTATTYDLVNNLDSFLVGIDDYYFTN